LLPTFGLLWTKSVFAVDVITNVVPDIANSQGGTGSGAVVNWVQSFYQFSLIGGVFLAVAVITWAGLKYALAAGNPSGQSDARDQILQALLGLVLLFGAFLVLYTINPNLTNLSLPTLKSVSSTAPTGGGGGGASGGWGTGSSTFIGGGGTSGGGGASGCFNCLTDSQVRQAFGQDIQIKPGARVEGLQQSIVNAVLDLKSSCPSCEIVVTEGTGGVHNGGTYSHANGFKVDIRLNDNLNNYIQNNFVTAGIRGDGAPLYRAPNGAVYAKESNHWDVIKS